VITLATTKMLYVDMAFNLARSFFFWNRGAGIDFHLFTDVEFPVPRELLAMKVSRLPPGALGTGFSPKLHLDKLAPAAQTMFIDADCLCVAPLGEVFDRFAGRAVSVVGDRVMTEGLWFGDVANICVRAGVKQLDGFNGGLYYLEPGPQANQVYARAREIEKVYDDWGLVRLRGHANDELLMAIALAEAGLRAVPSDGTMMEPFNSYPEFRELDVFAGRCVIANPPVGDKLHNSYSKVQVVHPRIPHFVDTFTDHWRYRSEVEKLRLYLGAGLPRWLARAVAFWTVALPGWTEVTFKKLLRPLYHALFGARPIGINKRV